MYDRREKALRDQRWLLTSARKEGLEEGLEQGLEQGLERGLEQGREEGEIRLIRTLQEIFGVSVSDAASLQGLSIEQLQAMTAELRSNLQNRQPGTTSST